MPRRPFVAGNWKMNTTPTEAAALARDVRSQLSMVRDRVEVAVAPPFVCIPAVAKVLEGSNVAVSAQHVHPAVSGAFTGEVSVPMLKDLGATWVIVGHSERRQYFGETDALVHQRAAAVLAGGLSPIVCVGETLAERESGQTLAVVDRQLKGALDGLPADTRARVVVAYEPVWAIGTGKTATARQAQEVHAHIRKSVAGLWGAEAAAALRIQYGGSVKADNAKELLGEADIDGALVGGASLKAGDFAAIVKAALEG